MVQSGKVVEPLGGRALLEEVYRWRCVLRSRPTSCSLYVPLSLSFSLSLTDSLCFLRVDEV